MNSDPNNTGNYTQDSDRTKKDREKKGRTPSFRQLVMSILGAALGVQSERTRQRDFSSPSPWPYILGGVIFGVIFIGVIALAVTLVLRNA